MSAHVRMEIQRWSPWLLSSTRKQNTWGKGCESDSDDFLNLVGSAVKFKSAESAKRSVDAGVAEQPDPARKRARKTSAAAQAGGSPSKPTGSPGKVTGAKKEPPRKTSRKLEKQELEINECAKVQVEAEQILTLLGCPAKFSMVKINAAQGCLKSWRSAWQRRVLSF